MLWGVEKIWYIHNYMRFMKRFRQLVKTLRLSRQFFSSWFQVPDIMRYNDEKDLQRYGVFGLCLSLVTAHPHLGSVDKTLWTECKAHTYSCL